MQPKEIYYELRSVADRLGLIVLEHNFRKTGIHVKSGYCKVRNQNHCIIDKHLKPDQKCDILAECLLLLPYESIFILPAAREYLESVKAMSQGKKKTAPGATAEPHSES